MTKRGRGWPFYVITSTSCALSPSVPERYISIGVIMHMYVCVCISDTVSVFVSENVCACVRAHISLELNQRLHHISLRGGSATTTITTVTKTIARNKNKILSLFFRLLLFFFFYKSQETRLKISYIF